MPWKRFYDQYTERSTILLVVLGCALVGSLVLNCVSLVKISNLKDAIMQEKGSIKEVQNKLNSINLKVQYNNLMQGNRMDQDRLDAKTAISDVRHEIQSVREQNSVLAKKQLVLMAGSRNCSQFQNWHYDYELRFRAKGFYNDDDMKNKRAFYHESLLDAKPELDSRFDFKTFNTTMWNQILKELNIYAWANCGKIDPLFYEDFSQSVCQFLNDQHPGKLLIRSSLPSPTLNVLHKVKFVCYLGDKQDISAMNIHQGMVVEYYKIKIEFDQILQIALVIYK